MPGFGELATTYTPIGALIVWFAMQWYMGARAKEPHAQDDPIEEINERLKDIEGMLNGKDGVIARLGIVEALMKERAK